MDVKEDPTSYGFREGGTEAAQRMRSIPLAISELRDQQERLDKVVARLLGQLESVLVVETVAPERDVSVSSPRLPEGTSALALQIEEVAIRMFSTVARVEDALARLEV